MFISTSAHYQVWVKALAHYHTVLYTLLTVKVTAALWDLKSFCGLALSGVLGTEKQNAYISRDASALTRLSHKLIVNRVAMSAISVEQKLAKMDNEEKTCSVPNRYYNFELLVLPQTTERRLYYIYFFQDIAIFCCISYQQLKHLTGKQPLVNRLTFK